jgi:hypothetical protein
MKRTFVSNVETAKQVSDVMLDVSSRLNQSIILVQDTCSAEEFKDYRRSVGAVMGEILLEVLNPLYKQHPSLKPKGLD